MPILNHTPALECDGALSDLILQAARQAIPSNVERLITLTGSLQAMFETQQALSEQGFDLLLQLADSVITYRSRHQRWQHPVALIDLLVRDHANPRSLACVVRTLHQQLRQLPAPHGEQLVARLEGGQLALDQLLGGYQRGTELLAFCRDRLAAVENQIKVLEGGELKPWSGA